MAGATCDTLEGDNNAFTVAFRKFFGKTNYLSEAEQLSQRPINCVGCVEETVVLSCVPNNLQPDRQVLWSRI